MSTTTTTLGKEAEENLKKLTAKMHELFQLDRGDLDFGLYRIMALKSAEVGKFLEDDLLPQVTEALGSIAGADRKAAQAKLDDCLKKAKGLGGIDPEDTDAVKKARAEVAAAKNNQQVEADIYNHLYNFFARYYDQGDFMSLRRYKSEGKEAYLIPYNGEEVKLHWANADQYYIKTTENYSSYVFIVGEGRKKRSVRLEISAADNEKDDIKESEGKQRYFVLAKGFIAEQGRDLIIRFEHRPLTDGEKTKYSKTKNSARAQVAINIDTERRIRKKVKGDWQSLLFAPCSPPPPTTEADSSRTLLGKHLAAYTAKNSFDYFIHKDLGSFLRRELNFYLKNEVISVDNLALTDDPAVFRRSLMQVNAVKHVGEKIIDFLAQLEDFQKQLWLKKKFVLETQYCVTLDKVPETLYPEITKNKAQVAEWVKLFSIDKLKGDMVQTAYSKQLKPKFLKENPYLVLDTKHFDTAFSNKLLAALSKAGSIEKQMNGLLVHGENFQALNLLQERYRGQVKSVYIDPPYNTKTSAILYKSNYKHSSWMTLMKNRLDIGKIFLQRDGVQVVAIDDTEFVVLNQILDQLFLDHDRNVIVVNHHPAGAGLEGTNISETHEYAIFMTPSQEDKVLFGRLKDTESSEISFMRTGSAESNLRKGRPKSFYCVLIDPKSFKVIGIEPPPNTENYPRGNTKEGFVRLYPVSNDGTERVWRRTYKSCIDEISAGNLVCKNGRSLYIKTSNVGKHRPIFSNWTDKKYNAGVYGTNILKNIMGDNLFSYPKSLYTVKDCINHITRLETHSFILDYFAGSGTTGHAVININREDNANHKYILAEVGHHFDSVLLPRMKKVVYSKEWKDGKPIDRKGISQLFRYIRIESYEDTLDSLVVNSGQDLVATAENKKFAEDYQLRYALGEETAESASLIGKDFTDPFNYTLSVVRDGIRRDVKADLIETFNFLLGLKLTSRCQIDDILTITGTTTRNENCLILWRNLDKINADKLGKWFAKHRESFGANIHRIYVNGDHTLNALKTPKDKWDAVTMEPVFQRLMFKGTDYDRYRR